MRLVAITGPCSSCGTCRKACNRRWPAGTVLSEGPSVPVCFLGLLVGSAPLKQACGLSHFAGRLPAWVPDHTLLHHACIWVTSCTCKLQSALLFDKIPWLTSVKSGGRRTWQLGCKWFHLLPPTFTNHIQCVPGLPLPGCS